LSKKLLFCFIISVSLFALFFSGCKKETEEEKVTKVLTQYYEAIKKEDYSTALGLMTDAAQKYFGSAENFKSTFQVPGIKVISYNITSVFVDKDNKARTQTSITYSISGVFSDKPVETSETKKDGLTRENGRWKIDVKFGPYKCVNVNKEIEHYDLKLKVYAIDIYPDYVTVNVSFRNTGKENIFILPYNKLTTLTCDGKQVLPTVDLPFSLDPNLYKGVTIPGGKLAPGFINFNGRIAPDAKKLDLKIDGNLNIVKKAKFVLELKDINL